MVHCTKRSPGRRLSRRGGAREVFAHSTRYVWLPVGVPSNFSKFISNLFYAAFFSCRIIRKSSEGVKRSTLSAGEAISFGFIRTCDLCIILTYVMLMLIRLQCAIS